MTLRPQNTDDAVMDRIGSHIADYRIVRRIGAGGMGEVFEGVNEQIGRRVALKVLRPAAAENRMAHVRFETEARAANSVKHPSVVPVTEVGQTTDGSRYLVMEFIDGDTLRAAHKAEPGPWPALRVLRLGVQLASVLAAAHDKYIIHRDLKPANIMLVPDPEVPGGMRVRLLDFGIAKLLPPQRPNPDADAGVTQTESREGLRTKRGILLGTPLYMSPEQCQDSAGVTAHSDVYSLGVILYELLSGQPPFLSDTDVLLLSRHLQETERPLRERVPQVSPDLAALVHSMLRKQPTERPSMAQVEQRFRAILQSQESAPAVGAASSPQQQVTESPLAPLGRIVRWRWGIPALLAAVLLGLFTLWGMHVVRGTPVADSNPSASSSPGAPIPTPQAPVAAALPTSAQPVMPKAEPPIAPVAPGLPNAAKALRRVGQPVSQPAPKTKASPRAPSREKEPDDPGSHIELVD